MLARELRRIPVEFDSCHLKPHLPGGGKEVACATSHVEERSHPWNVVCRQEEAMSRLERHDSLIPALVCRFVPRDVRHRGRMPELKVAGRTAIQ
jgi:hypothetical protein